MNWNCKRGRFDEDGEPFIAIAEYWTNNVRTLLRNRWYSASLPRWPLHNRHVIKKREEAEKAKAKRVGQVTRLRLHFRSRR